jgi:hypothetical protein
MWMESRLAGPVALAFSLRTCSLPGGSKKLSPARYTFARPVEEFSERICARQHMCPDASGVMVPRRFGAWRIGDDVGDEVVSGRFGSSCAATGLTAPADASQHGVPLKKRAPH